MQILSEGDVLHVLSAGKYSPSFSQISIQVESALASVFTKMSICLLMKHIVEVELKFLAMLAPYCEGHVETDCFVGLRGPWVKYG